MTSVVVAFVGAIIYLLPSIIAAHRHVHNKWLILLVNVLVDRHGCVAG